MPRAMVCPVDLAWHAVEGAELGKVAGTPRLPLIVGGSGQIGLNLVALLGNSPKCERIRVLDLNPPMPAVINSISKPVEFVRFRLGADSTEDLAEHFKDIDCVFSVITPNVQYATAADLYSTNLAGVEQLTKVCVDRAIARLVHLGSIAVSNSFIPSVNQNESTPLPELETYRSPYDLSKRKGEMVVLKANSAATKTCSLRPGGVMCSTRDFFFSNVWPILPGTIIAPIGTTKVDFVDARDVVRGLLMAAQALEERPDGVAGEAFWLTKGTPIIPGATAKLAAEYMGFRFVRLPDWFLPVFYCLGWLWHCMKLLTFGWCKVSGVLPHWFIEMSAIEQTFDSSKIQQRLGFKPKVDMRDATRRICDLYLQEIGQELPQKKSQ